MLSWWHVRPLLHAGTLTQYLFPVLRLCQSTLLFGVLAHCPQPSADHADTAKSGELLQQLLGSSLELPTTVYSVGFCGLLAAMCYSLRPAQLDKANAGLLAAVFISFAVCPPSPSCPSHPNTVVI